MREQLEPGSKHVITLLKPGSNQRYRTILERGSNYCYLEPINYLEPHYKTS